MFELYNSRSFTFVKEDTLTQISIISLNNGNLSLFLTGEVYQGAKSFHKEIYQADGSAVPWWNLGVMRKSYTATPCPSSHWS